MLKLNLWTKLYCGIGGVAGEREHPSSPKCQQFTSSVDCSIVFGKLLLLFMKDDDASEWRKICTKQMQHALKQAMDLTRCELRPRNNFRHTIKMEKSKKHDHRIEIAEIRSMCYTSLLQIFNIPCAEDWRAKHQNYICTVAHTPHTTRVFLTHIYVVYVWWLWTATAARRQRKVWRLSFGKFICISCGKRQLHNRQSDFKFRANAMDIGRYQCCCA